MSFQDVEVSLVGHKFATTVYRKTHVYAPFDSSLSTTYKFGIIYTLIFRLFQFFQLH